MPNLEYLGGLDIKDATGLQNVTMPRLKEVTGRVSIEMKRGWRLDFRSLERAPAIRVVGRLEEIHLDSLQTVNNDLVVNNCGACGDWDGTNAVMKYKDALVLSLGSLVSVGYIEIAGYLRAIGISNLISAGPPQDPDDGSLSMDSGARFHLAQVMASFSLNLTKLESVNKQLYIHGELDGLSIPALKTANATIHIDASTPLDIDLPLKTANSIDLLGRITSVHLPNLTPSTPITLTSTYKCKPLDSVTNVTCAIPSPGLSMEAKVGMGMGITVGVALVMFAVVFCCRRSRGRKMTGRSSSELADLPAYGDSNSRARATGSPVVPVPQGRPETPPPPYSVDPA
ncbi:hypothetical protein BJX61DRAFT_230047 [Aspergillus egyptiacus]|nr:hypothetical protein BJX61DRAFT_230047 [Aspergillus egyptiacus]